MFILVPPNYRQSLQSIADSYLSWTRHEMSNVTDLTKTENLHFKNGHRNTKTLSIFTGARGIAVPYGSLKNCQVTYFCCPHSVAPEVHSPSNGNNWQVISLGVKCGTPTADNLAVTVVVNGKIKVNATHSIPYLSLHELLGKPSSLPSPLSRPTQ
jgi:hypothetical protein